jgi:glycosyltransferase involved in cell wall biosynthesis
VTAPLPEPWHPQLEKEGGAGGAETCIMRLAPRFAADGWRVSVFGTPGHEHYGVDENGVEWWNSEEFVPNEKFKVLIASRIPDVFGATLAAEKKYLWMHDVNVGPNMIPYLDLPDKIVGLTNWHAQHMSRLYQTPMDRFHVIPNGIELDLYDLSKRKDNDGKLRFIWSSSADRGLGTLISMWPQIKEMYPTSQLDVYYGWNIIDKMIARGDRRAGYLLRLKIDILSNIDALGGEEAGIYQHGRIPQHELAKRQLESHIWGYPTDFMETFCITALEMQAAGVIPITSRLAALTEVVANDGLMIEGWPLNNDYQKRWLKLLDSVVDSQPEQVDEMRQLGRSHAEQFTWDAAYSKWNDLFGM